MERMASKNKYESEYGYNPIRVLFAIKDNYKSDMWTE